MLRGAGFQLVDTRNNLNAAEMRRALRDFSDRIRDADIAVVYYAGHGMQVGGSNFLVPVDADVPSERAVPLVTLLRTRSPLMLPPMAP